MTLCVTLRAEQVVIVAEARYPPPDEPQTPPETPPKASDDDVG